MKKVLFTLLLCVSFSVLYSCASTDDKIENDKAAQVTEEVSEPVLSEAKMSALEEAGAIDLSTWETVDVFGVKYDDEKYTLTVDGSEYFQFPLEKPINAGDVITVHITGINNGEKGFRSWVVDNNQTTNCANPDGLYYTTKDPNFIAGNFDITYNLEATAPSTYLFIKGIQWGTMIDKLTITSIAVTYN